LSVYAYFAIVASATTAESEKSFSVWFIRFLVVSLLEMTVKSVNYFLSVMKDAPFFYLFNLRDFAPIGVLE